MVRGFICGLLVLVCALGFMPGFSAQVWAAEFSADLIQDISGQAVRGKIYIKGSKMRIENKQEGVEFVMILDSGRGTAYMLTPKDKVYLEMPGAMVKDKMGRINVDEELTGIADKKNLGTENIDGYLCDKYKITYHDRSLGKTIQWHCKKLNFPIKSVSSSSYGTTTVEYKNIKEETLSGALFEIPPGYRNMGIPGMSQEDILGSLEGY